MTLKRSRKSRAQKTQVNVADYLQPRGWPFARSTPSGMPGIDILETPDIAIEVKAATDFEPLAWLRQAEKNADGRLPIVVSRRNGQGDDAGQYLACLRFEHLVQLLQEAGYGDSRGKV